MDNEATQRDVLRLLYALHDEDPPGLIECKRLAERLQMPKAQVAGSIRKLERKGYIDVVARQRGAVRFEFVQITPDGIDLVEHLDKLDGEFPRQEVHQHIYFGDRVEVTVGDHATNVAIGKGVYQVNVGSQHPLGEVVSRLIEKVSTQEDLSDLAVEEVEGQFKEMLSILREPEPDLGALQEMRRSLVSRGGWVEAATLAFFRQPEVVVRIRQAAECLIGEQEETDGVKER